MIRRAIAAIVLVCLPPVAFADDKQSCIDAHAETQRYTKLGELARAHASALKCAASTCPSVLRAECVGWVGELETKVPTIIVVASVDGVEVSDARVSIDGAPTTERVAGQAIAIEPGEHEVRAEREGREPLVRKIVILQSDRMRRIELSWTTPKPEPPKPAPIAVKTPVEKTVPPREEPARPMPVTPLILGGVALVGYASFATFAITGRIRHAELEGACAPACASDDVASVRRSYLIADLALGVAVVATGAALFTWFGQGRSTAVVAPTASPHGAGLVVAFRM